MWIDGTRYYFKLGDKHRVIVRLKKFLNARSFIKTKNTNTEVFDETFQASLIEYQTRFKLKQQDGSLNAETYAHFGTVVESVVVDQIALGEPILRKLIYGVGVVPERIKITNGVPFLINNNETPVHATSGKTFIPSPNGNAADIATDEKLAILLGDETQKPTVRGTSLSGVKNTGDHYVLENGLVYTLHIYGPTGNEFIDIYSPAGFEKPILSSNNTPGGNGYFNLACTNSKTGAVLRFAHLDSIQSQADLDRAWNTKMTNSVGSRYIGTIGTSGGIGGSMHSHITYYVNAKAADAVRSQKKGYNEVHDPKYYADFKSLVDGSR